MSILAKTGKRTLETCSEASRIAASVVAVIRVTLDARCWASPVSRVLVNQLYFSGVQAFRLVMLISVLCGIAMVSQIQLWLSNVGQSDLTGEVLVEILVCTLAPLFVGFVLIGRSGTAVCAELAGMRHRGELNVLEAQGIDTFIYLVMPRTIAIAVSTFLLSVQFVFVSLISGWATGVLSGAADSDMPRFFSSIFLALAPADIFIFLLKTLLGGLLIGVVSSVEGLSTKGLSTEIPQAVTRGVVLAIATLITMSLIISLLFYVY